MNWILLNLRFLRFSGKNIRYICCTYSPSGQKLDIVLYYKDLDVMLDSQFAYSLNISDTMLKTHKTLGFIIKTCSELNNICFVLIPYNLLISFHLEYFTVKWSPSCLCRIDKILCFTHSILYSRTNYYIRNIFSYLFGRLKIFYDAIFIF